MDDSLTSEERRCLGLLDKGCHGPGVLKVVVTDQSVAVRWSLPKSVTDQCPSKFALSWALNYAPGCKAYTDLHSIDDKYEWVNKMALGLDGVNRGQECSGLLTGVLSAFHDLDDVYRGDADPARDKSYPRLSKWGRCRMVMMGDDPGAAEYNVMNIDAYATDFRGEGTASLNMCKPSLRKLMTKIDEKEGALFLKDTCWKIEFYDKRTAIDARPWFAKMNTKIEVKEAVDHDEGGGKRLRDTVDEE